LDLPSGEGTAGKDLGKKKKRTTEAERSPVPEGKVKYPSKGCGDRVAAIKNI